MSIEAAEVIATGIVWAGVLIELGIIVGCFIIGAMSK